MADFTKSVRTYAADMSPIPLALRVDLVVVDRNRRELTGLDLHQDRMRHPVSQLGRRAQTEQVLTRVQRQAELALRVGVGTSDTFPLVPVVVNDRGNDHSGVPGLPPVVVRNPTCSLD